MILTMRNSTTATTVRAALAAPCGNHGNMIQRTTFVGSKRTFFASSTDHTTLIDKAVIHRISDAGQGAYGSREYVLVPEDIPLDLVKKDGKLKLASLRANRNIIFGAKVVAKAIGSMDEVCGGLLDAALQDASMQGEQPQGLATLHGLCDWVCAGIRDEEEIELLESFQETDPVTYEAVVAIATGVPRESHTVVGMGTFRDGQYLWGELAKEFIRLRRGDEARLYESKGGEFVAIEHLVDSSENYVKSAGGAMARFFFL